MRLRSVSCFLFCFVSVMTIIRFVVVVIVIFRVVIVIIYIGGDVLVPMNMDVMVNILIYTSTLYLNNV